MREILFRGKRTDNGEWVYGVPTKDARNETVIVESVFECDEYSCRGAYCFYVDENTIGQYTGLTDKNGKKIFEGDIVLDHFTSQKGIVTFCQGTFDSGIYKYNGWVCKGFDGTVDFRELVFYEDTDCEVIGNIHDNPELLKGEE